MRGGCRRPWQCVEQFLARQLPLKAAVILIRRQTIRKLPKERPQLQCLVGNGILPNGEATGEATRALVAAQPAEPLSQPARPGKEIHYRNPLIRSHNRLALLFRLS